MTKIPEKSVVILGAGLAGLAAGWALKKRGYEVVILEARDRIGGRVDTRVVQEDPLVTIEMGAEWVGQLHHRIQTLCKEFGLKLVDHNLDTSLSYKGKYYPPGKWGFSRQWRDKLREWQKSFPQLTEEKIKELEETDWWHFLASNHIPQRDIDILDLIESTDYGENTRFVAAYDVLSDFETGGTGEAATYARIEGGNRKLPEAFAERIGMESIHLGRVVTEVEQGNGTVTVWCADGSEWTGVRVICTLPAKGVAAVRWSPELPEKQKKAYEILDYARIIKVSVTFSHRFWGEKFEMATDTLADFIYHSTQNQPGEHGILTSYAVGDRAYVLSHQTDEEKIKTVCDALKPAFGDVLPFALSVQSQAWEQDPYTGGAYALFEKDPLETQELLRTPHGKVLFAGEHTADLRGFMEGAILTGEECAKNIAD